MACMKTIRSYLEQNHNIDPSYSIELLADYINLVYSIKNASDHFIFRIFPVEKDIEFINSEIHLLIFLKNLGLNVETVINHSKNMGYGVIQLNHSTRTCALYQGLNGCVHDELLSNTQSNELGEITGKLHSSLDLYCGPSHFKEFGFEEFLWKPLRVIKPYIHHNTELYEFYKNTIENSQNKLNQNQQFLSWGICHGDLHAGNVLFELTDKPGFFDFELTCKSWRLYDIATFVWSIFPREDYSIEAVERINKSIECFLSGYMKQRLLKAEELELILDMVLTRHIWRQAERIEMDRKNALWKSEQHFQEQMYRMKKWNQIYREIKFHTQSPSLKIDSQNAIF